VDLRAALADPRVRLGVGMAEPWPKVLASR